MSKITLSASILSADFSNLKQELLSCEQAGIDWIHIDVMDGHFVPNITMGPFIVEACKKITRLPLDVHLMIENPDRYVEAFANAGASRLTIHGENHPHVFNTLERIQSLGVKTGIALNPGTPASQITPLLSILDMVLVMTVNPGFSGQKFIPSMASKIRQVSEILQTEQSPALIQVDGGITTETLPVAYQSGARVFVAATAIFKYPQGISGGSQALRASVA